MINLNMPSHWIREFIYILRYGSSGVVNTVVGFIVIFSALAVGFSPITSNVLGYGVGFFLGFVFSKKFVFRTNGHFVAESIRYLIVFLISFIFNLFILRFSLNYLNLNVMISQGLASTGFTVLMYLFTRIYVFNQKVI